MLQAQKRTSYRSGGRPVIGLAIETSSGFGRQIARGVIRYASSGQKWVFMEDFHRRIETAAGWAECDGMIVDSKSMSMVQGLMDTIGNVVVCSGSLPELGLPQVCLDETLVGKLAADHLMQCGLRDFGYYVYAGNTYRLSERRRIAFETALTPHGFTSNAFAPQEPATVRGPATLGHWPALIAWMRALPKPAGVFATDDAAARDLLAAAIEGGISIPGEIAVIGVNNDDLLCESAWPPLTSIDAGFDRIGLAAARTLDRMLAGEELTESERQIRFAPLGVVARASTELLAVDDADLALAMQYIRKHACDPCTVGDVVRHVAVSRRRLERRCVAMLGCTLHDQIVRVQVLAARRMLMRSDADMVGVAKAAGCSAAKLNRLFRSTLGESPSAWRNRQRRETTV